MFMKREIKLRYTCRDISGEIFEIFKVLTDFLNEGMNKHTRIQEIISVDEFTGIIDSNGVEIYESDIVICYDNAAEDENWGLDKTHTGVIEYAPNCFILKIPGIQTINTPCLKHWENDVCLDKWVNAENIIKIGNIYQDPNF